MYPVVAIIHVTGFFPLLCAFGANRRTTLEHALGWAAAAWLAWVAVILSGWIESETFPKTASYLALSLTACAGIAVLGARRPGVAAWNFVLAGLLAVLLLPIAEGWGELRLSLVRAALLVIVLLVVPFNYVPTRFGVAALVLAAGCGLEVGALVLHAGIAENASLDPFLVWGRLAVAVSPWMAWSLAKTRSQALSDFDRLWLAFRDRFGLTWALRVREQFNRAAANAGWTAHLGWKGLQGHAGDDVLNTLRALLKRFGPATNEAT